MYITGIQIVSRMKRLALILLLFVFLGYVSQPIEGQSKPKKKVTKQTDKSGNKKKKSKKPVNKKKKSPKTNKKSPKKQPKATSKKTYTPAKRPDLSSVTRFMPKDTASSITFGLIEEYDKVIKEEFTPIINDSSLQLFFGKLQSLEKGEKRKVRILHIGDSHLQPGYFASWIRTELQKKYGYAGFGLFYPYALSNIYTRMGLFSWSDTRWESRRNMTGEKGQYLGVSGYSVKTDAPSWKIGIGVVPFNTIDNRFDRITLFHSAGTTNPLITPLRPIITGKDTDSGPWDDTAIKMALDSSHGNWMASTYSLPLPTNEMVIISGENDEKSEPFIFYGGTGEMSENSGIIYHEAGVGGSQLPLFTRTTLFFDQVKEISPDLVIVSLGTNESYSPEYDTVWYEKRVTELIMKIRSESPLTAFILMTPPDILYRKKYPRYMQAIINIFKRVGEKENVAIWDWNAIMGGKGSIGKWVAEKLAQSDNIHMTPKGYRLTAALFLKSFEESYNNFKQNLHAQ